MVEPYNASTFNIMLFSAKGVKVVKVTGKCDSCGRIGHRTWECRSQPVRSSGPREPNEPVTGAEEKPKDITCWKCFQKGHIAINCPGVKVMFCDNEQRRKCRSYPRAVRAGLVDGVAVSDIMLDTGSNRTLIRGDLVTAEKLVKGEIPTRCAHGDIMTYPIAEVELEIGGRHRRQVWSMDYQCRCSLDGIIQTLKICCSAKMGRSRKLRIKWPSLPMLR